MQLLMIQWKSSLNYAFPQLEETGQVTWNTKSIRNFKTIENSAARRDYKNSYLKSRVLNGDLEMLMKA